ncbi:MAG: hypothetical protein H7256_14645 [Bdellovibrio sp.]|nr:hypothetical protein [Bdellovibrio sp.]
MKTNLSTLIIGAAFVALTGCGDKGSDNKNAAIPGLPEGRIAVTSANGQTDLNNYCDVAPDQKSMTCATSVPGANGTAVACPGITVAYTDQISMCNNLAAALRQNVINNNGLINGQCSSNSGRVAMQFTYQRLCANVANTNNTNNNGLPGQLIPPMVGGGTIIQNTSRVIRCDFKAVHTVGNYVKRIFPFSSSEGLAIQKRKAIIDGGERFGKAEFSYDNRNDKITIKATGINKDTDVIQTASADQEVRLEVRNDDGSVNVVLSCKDVAGVAVTRSEFSSYNCKGKSRLGLKTETVNKTVSLEDLNYDQVELAKGLTIGMRQGMTGLNNALISLEATGVSVADSTVLSSASIYSAAQILIDDGASKVDVVCQPQR